MDSFKKKSRFNSNFDGQKAVRQPSDFPFRVVKALESTRDLNFTGREKPDREQKRSVGSCAVSFKLRWQQRLASAPSEEIEKLQNGKAQLDTGTSEPQSGRSLGASSCFICALYSPHVRATCSGGCNNCSTGCYVLVCCITALMECCTFVRSWCKHWLPGARPLARRVEDFANYPTVHWLELSAPKG